MSDDTRAVIIIGIDVVIWLVALWILAAPKDSATRAQMYWYAARGCQACAVWFGELAMEAELRYYAEVQ